MGRANRGRQADTDMSGVARAGWPPANSIATPPGSLGLGSGELGVGGLVSDRDDGGNAWVETGSEVSELVGAETTTLPSRETDRLPGNLGGLAPGSWLR